GLDAEGRALRAEAAAAIGGHVDGDADRDPRREGADGEPLVDPTLEPGREDLARPSIEQPDEIAEAPRDHGGPRRAQVLLHLGGGDADLQLGAVAARLDPRAAGLAPDGVEPARLIRR